VYIIYFKDYGRYLQLSKIIDSTKISSLVRFGAKVGGLIKEDVLA
jgi:hypothetical protein